MQHGAIAHQVVVFLQDARRFLHAGAFAHDLDLAIPQVGGHLQGGFEEFQVLVEGAAEIRGFSQQSNGLFHLDWQPNSSWQAGRNNTQISVAHATERVKNARAAQRFGGGNSTFGTSFEASEALK